MADTITQLGARTFYITLDPLANGAELYITWPAWSLVIPGPSRQLVLTNAPRFPSGTTATANAKMIKVIQYGGLTKPFDSMIVNTTPGSTSDPNDVAVAISNVVLGGASSATNYIIIEVVHTATA